MKVYAISDLHVDDPTNLAWLASTCAGMQTQDDLLIVAGDVSESLDKLNVCFELLLSYFAELVFVPGNHELWTRASAPESALDKLGRVLELCSRAGVHVDTVEPDHAGESARVVPLMSWYALPDDPHEGQASLYRVRPGRDLGLSVWRDSHLVRWPAEVLGQGPSTMMAARNRYSAPAAPGQTTITVSHFLPRWEVIPPPAGSPAYVAPRVGFNFSRVAGSTLIESQLRALGSDIHIYGHQHRNRDITVDGVRYVSSCLGYPSERRDALIDPAGVNIKQIWPAE